MADKGQALRNAARNGEVDEARRLLDEGANIEFTDHVRRPPCAAWRRARVCGRAALVHARPWRRRRLRRRARRRHARSRRSLAL